MSSTIKVEDPFDRPPVPVGKFALFNYGFRPFFFFAGLFGAVSILFWVGLYAGHMDLNLTSSDALWHAHEMLFGYTTAAIAGFFLTVIPSLPNIRMVGGIQAKRYQISWRGNTASIPRRGSAHWTVCRKPVSILHNNNH